MLDELASARKVVGIKQLRKALKNGDAAAVFLACDADPMLIEPVREEASAAGVPITEVPRMEDLGKACGIHVGAACAAIVR